MKRYTPTRLLGLLTATALLWGASTSLYAAGTASGVSISNTATLNYTIGAVAQDPVSSPAATFVVDNKVDLTMVSTGVATVIPGSTDQVLPFTLTNTGNTTQGYLLSTVDGTGDNFNMNSVRIYVDVNGAGALDVGDTLYTTGTNAGNLAPDAQRKFLIVANTPSTATDNQTAIYHLLATTTNAGSTTVTTQDTGADAAGTVQVVFADAAGTASGDTARSGTQSSTSTYTVDTAALAVTKTSSVISDPLNSTTNPKAIPGAVVRYTITLTNPNAAVLRNASFTDTFPAQIAIATTPAASTTCTGGTLTDPAGGSLGGGDTGIRLSGGTIAANGSCTITVTIMPSDASAPYNANVVNTIAAGSLATTEGASNSAAITSGNLSVQTGGEVNLTFSPTSVAANGQTYSTLTLKLRNRNLTAVSGASLSRTLPANLVIASPNGLTTSNCGTPTVTAAPGTSSINITGAAIAAATTTSGNYGECVIAVRVVATSTTGSPFSVQVPAGSFGAGLPSYSASNAVTLTATAPAITATKVFSPATVGPGATSTLTITLQNSKSAAATITSFTDNLTTLGATGYTVAASPAASTTCGGTLNATPGGTAITMSSGTIPAATGTVGTCTITVPVQVGSSVSLGTRTNTIAAGAIQTSQGNNASAVTATLKISAPTVAKAVSPTSVVQGQTATFTITLTNPSSTAATITSFTDNLTTMDASGRVTVAPTPAASTTCGGTLSAAPGATSVSLTGGSIPASSSCTITVPVQPTPNIPTGSKTNTIAAGGLQTNLGNNASAATRAVTVNTGMTCGKAFSPASVGPGRLSPITCQPE